MKRSLMLSLFVGSLLVGTLGAPAFAGDKDSGKVQEQIASLRQASAELKATNADLSNKLEDMANKKQEWLAKRKDCD